jgi:hypothetical protein
MFSVIRRRITPGMVIATVALVFAMTGGAYAAKKFLITSTKQISPSVLKALKGKAGPAGPAGPGGVAGAGTVGAAGPQGPAGATGAKGETGAAGTPGAPGAKGVQGEEGKQGAIHPGETLPSEATETGTWSMTIGKVVGFLGAGVGISPISFTVPLTAALENEAECGEAGKQPCHIQVKPESYDGTDNTGTEHEQCPGTAADAKAAPGFLCVYTNEDFSITPKVQTSTPDGVVLLAASASEGFFDYGTWAVTAE